MVDIHSLLAEMSESKASDLHIIAGSPILLRVAGRLTSAPTAARMGQSSFILPVEPSATGGKPSCFLEYSLFSRKKVLTSYRPRRGTGA